MRIKLFLCKEIFGIAILSLQWLILYEEMNHEMVIWFHLLSRTGRMEREKQKFMLVAVLQTLYRESGGRQLPFSTGSKDGKNDCLPPDELSVWVSGGSCLRSPPRYHKNDCCLHMEVWYWWPETGGQAMPPSWWVEGKWCDCSLPHTTMYSRISLVCGACICWVMPRWIKFCCFSAWPKWVGWSGCVGFPSRWWPSCWSLHRV